MNRFVGRSVFVSGGASGIGRATVLRFAREGARVAVGDVDAGAARETVRAVTEGGGDGLALALDVTNEASWKSALDATVARFGGLDVLVNNAGVSAASPIADTTLSDWRRIMSVNLDGVFLGTKHAIQVMRDSQKRSVPTSTAGTRSIVNVASASGVKAAAGAAAYCASKAAVIMLTRVAAQECAQAGDGIRVNCVLPGGTQTPMWDQMPFFRDLVEKHGSREAAFAAMAADTPTTLGRMALPDEIAGAIAFLASDECAFITGAALAVDGGYTA